MERSSSAVPNFESFSHQSVLLDEVIHFLEPETGKVIVDGTLGGAGHALAMLEAGAKVIGLDQDPTALHHANEKLSAYTVGPSQRFCSVEADKGWRCPVRFASSL